MREDYETNTPEDAARYEEERGRDDYDPTDEEILRSGGRPTWAERSM